MKAIDLAIKDLLQIFRDWRAAIFLLVMPIAFTVLFGFAFGGFGGVEDEDPRLPVIYFNGDSGAVSQQLIAVLAESQVIRIEETDENDTEKLQKSVEDNDTAGVLIIPAEYSQDIESGQLVPVRLIIDAGTPVGQSVMGEIQTASSRVHSALRSAIFSSQLYDDSFGFSAPGAQEAFFEETMAAAVDAWSRPPVGIIVSSSGSDEDSSAEGPENSFAHPSAGMMGQFAIAGLMGAATILVLEKKDRVLQRLLTAPISKTEILLGHYLAMFVMIVVQLIILILFGQILLDLNYLGSPAATGLLVAATALFAASLGLLIGAVAKSEEQVIFLALIPMFVLAGLGGAWVPLEITPEAFQAVAKITPLSWVVEGFKDITIRGLGVEAVAPGVLVLLAYTAVLIGVAIWRFRYE